MVPENYKSELIQWYQNSPVIRGLIELVGGLTFGIVPGVDAFVMQKINNIKKERLHTFFDELGSGNVKLTPDLIKSEDFLHCFFATVNATMKTRRPEKIRRFARLLKSAIRPNIISDTDEYEEFLNILDDLTDREFSILLLIEAHESMYPIPEDDNSSEVRQRSRYWHLLLYEIEEKLSDNQKNYQQREISAILTRLTRTGCYEILPDDMSTLHNMRDHTLERPGRLTPLFYQLKQLIADEDGDIV